MDLQENERADKLKAERKKERMARELHRTAEMTLCSMIISGRFGSATAKDLAALSHQVAREFLLEVAKYEPNE